MSSAVAARAEMAPVEEGALPLASAAHLRVGRQVLELEADALRRCAGALDGSFADACKQILACKGRVVTTGMGKSGHIARKLAATLASTGTPAFFVHPGEASHGDLGMLGPGDLVVALSNSGETTELGDIVTYTRRFRLGLVALVGRAPSTLADNADVALVLPPLGEACPMGLAPTTSTTAMLAIGDALAAAVLAAKGFDRTDFAVYHPGGKLGARLVRVRDIMHAGDAMPVIGPDRPMVEASVEMTKKRLGCVGVVEGERLIGIVTDGDLRRHLDQANLLEAEVARIMTPAPRTIGRDALAAEALAEMTEREPHVTQLFVTGSGLRPQGVIHLHDCLHAGIA